MNNRASLTNIDEPNKEVPETLRPISIELNNQIDLIKSLSGHLVNLENRLDCCLPADMPKLNRDTNTIDKDSSNSSLKESLFENNNNIENIIIRIQSLISNLEI